MTLDDSTRDQAPRLRSDWMASLLRTITIAALLASLESPAGAAAREQGASELDVKAAFLFNFTRFVDWPPQAFSAPSDPFRICVVAQPDFVAALDSIIRGESVRGRELQRVIPGPGDVPRCQILYVGADESERAARLLALARNAPVLTVGDSPRFLDAGGGVGFVVDGGRLRFDIDLRRTSRSGLVVSSKLLRVARNVREETR